MLPPRRLRSTELRPSLLFALFIVAIQGFLTRPGAPPSPSLPHAGAVRQGAGADTLFKHAGYGIRHAAYGLIDSD